VCERERAYVCVSVCVSLCACERERVEREENAVFGRLESARLREGACICCAC
jgi:hypothetical protein